MEDEPEDDEDEEEEILSSSSDESDSSDEYVVGCEKDLEEDDDDGPQHVAPSPPSDEDRKLKNVDALLRYQNNKVNFTAPQFDLRISIYTKMKLLLFFKLGFDVY